MYGYLTEVECVGEEGGVCNKLWVRTKLLPSLPTLVDVVDAEHTPELLRLGEDH